MDLIDGFPIEVIDQVIGFGPADGTEDLIGLGGYISGFEDGFDDG